MGENEQNGDLEKVSGRISFESFQLSGHGLLGGGGVWSATTPIMAAGGSVLSGGGGGPLGGSSG